MRTTKKQQQQNASVLRWMFERKTSIFWEVFEMKLTKISKRHQQKRLWDEWYLRRIHVFWLCRISMNVERSDENVLKIKWRSDLTSDSDEYEHVRFPLFFGSIHIFSVCVKTSLITNYFVLNSKIPSLAPTHFTIYFFLCSLSVRGLISTKWTTNKSHQLIFNDERQTNIYAIHWYIPYSLDSFVLSMNLPLFELNRLQQISISVGFKWVFSCVFLGFVPFCSRLLSLLAFLYTQNQPILTMNIASIYVVFAVYVCVSHV